MDEISFGHHNSKGSNYKHTVICQLLGSKDLTQTRENLCIALSDNNPSKPHPYFKKHNTVFDVLSNRLGLIEKVGNCYRLKGNFSNDQLKELKLLCVENLEILTN